MRHRKGKTDSKALLDAVRGAGTEAEAGADAGLAALIVDLARWPPPALALADLARWPAEGACAAAAPPANREEFHAGFAPGFDSAPAAPDLFEPEDLGIIVENKGRYAQLFWLPPHSSHYPSPPFFGCLFSEVPPLNPYST
jgi:hypothetical protein